MAYVVVHGADRARDLPASASECLELVKTLQARAEAPIEITDDRGAPLGLRDLEALHKTEVENGPLIRSAPAAEFREGARQSLGENKGRLAAGLLMASAMVAVIGLIVSHNWAPGESGIETAGGEASHGAVTGPVEAPKPDPETGGGHSAAQAAKEQPAGSRGGEPMGSGEGAPSSYTVVANDTLRGVAKKLFHDAGRWRDIAQANPDIDPNRLRPGQVIALPKAPRLAGHK